MDNLLNSRQICYVGELSSIVLCTAITCLTWKVLTVWAQPGVPFKCGNSCQGWQTKRGAAGMILYGPPGQKFHVASMGGKVLNWKAWARWPTICPPTPLDATCPLFWTSPE
jgi:hypothetical protein